MKILGITGGTGSGKTTLLGRVRAMGGAVIDCDAVYHGLLQTDLALLGELKGRFPGAFPRGVWNRRELGKLVFEDAAALADLNRITHRYVLEAVTARLREAEGGGCALAAIDAIGLAESGLAGKCHVTIAVRADREARVRRLMAREGISRDYACARIAAQKTDAEFSECCDVTLVNDCETLAAFEAKCDELLLKLTGGQACE